MNQYHDPENGEEAAAHLEEIARLLELRGENPFKVRAFEKAAAVVAALPDFAERVRMGTLQEVRGIGASIADTIREFMDTGHSKAREESLASLPPGLLDLLRVPRLGPKRARQVIEELGIRDIEGLEAACREGRLVTLKGFSDSTQQRILDGIALLRSFAGKLRLDDAEAVAGRCKKLLITTVNQGRHPAAASLRVSEVGEYRRRWEVISSLDYLIELPLGDSAPREIRARVEEAIAAFKSEHFPSLSLGLHFAPSDRFGRELFRLTGSEDHLRVLGILPEPEAASEEEIYRSLGLPWIPPEMRETGEEVSLARSGALGAVVETQQIRGLLHVHSDWSDGRSTLEEMVAAAAARGYQYIGISDHSQTSGYAGGLKPERLLEQHRAVRELQPRYPGIRIFHGVESDILSDGSLDYEPDVLSQLDFVVASVHSGFNIGRAAMTERILRALRSPFVRILAHPTGRNLLERKEYEVDLEEVIRCAAVSGVAIEINSNPARLDIDWRWGPAVRKFGGWVAIDPDAHEVSGLDEVRYGVMVARKALLPAKQILNSLTTEEIEAWLKSKRSSRF